jgi:hypothetical protein
MTSAQCQSRRFLDVRAKSAYPLKAAVRSDIENGSDVPICDIQLAMLRVGHGRRSPSPKLLRAAHIAAATTIL